MPLLNEAVILPAMIKSMQQIGADELRFVDGGSSDGTQQLLAQSAVDWTGSEPGRARQMNAGALQCKSDILVFIHADTIFSSSHIAAVKAAMKDQSCVGGRFDVALSGSHPAFSTIAWLMNLRSRLSRISTGDQCIFVRRQIFEGLGGFPELPLMEDIAFSKRLKKAGKIACLRERVTTSSRRWQQGGIVRTVLLMWRMRLLFWLGWPAEKLALIYRQAR